MHHYPAFSFPSPCPLKEYLLTLPKREEHSPTRIQNKILMSAFCQIPTSPSIFPYAKFKFYYRLIIIKETLDVSAYIGAGQKVRNGKTRTNFLASPKIMLE